MFATIKTTYRIAANDLRLELRSKDAFVSTLLFALLMAVISSLAFYLDRNTARQIAPGVLWLAIAFSGVLAMSRSWLRERERSVIDSMLLTPAPRTGIFLGKVVSTLIFMAVVEALLVVAVVVLCQLSQIFADQLFEIALWLPALLVTGSIGFIAAGTLFASMSVRSSMRELTLSIVLFPLAAPALLAAVVATRQLFSGAPLAELGAWVRILLAFDLVFVVVCPLLFERLFREPPE